MSDRKLAIACILAMFMAVAIVGGYVYFALALMDATPQPCASPCGTDCACPGACKCSPKLPPKAASVSRTEFDSLVELVKKLLEQVEPEDSPEVKPATPPTVGLVGISGDTTADVGRMVHLIAVGTATKFDWNIDPQIEKAENFTLDSDGRKLSFSSPIPGTFTFFISGRDETNVKGHRHTVVVGKPPPVVVVPDKPPVVTPDPTVRPTRATYVYEQRQGSVPPPVLAALNKLNRAGVVATSIDQNVISGKGQAPAQYAVALSEAKKAGIPCLVVQAGDVVLRVVPRPLTEDDVMKAVK